MNEISFEWDERQEHENRRKHGISFEAAKTVFFDENAVEIHDDEHSEWEDRFLMLGLSGKLRILLVCHGLRDDGSVIRIISARRATKNERAFYRRGAK